MDGGVAFGSQYLLGDLVGSGAMGKVYTGRVRDSDEQVAIKILRDDLASDNDLVARFIQERRVIKSIRSPHVVGVRDLVVEGDQLGIVMELVTGGDLRRSVRVPLKVGDALEMVSQVGSGLVAVHGAGVIHRDLKPENVLIDATGNQRVLKVTDFGVARLVGQTLTRVTSLLGTPGYMAPELARGERPTAAADIYALGAMLFELMTGRPPFVADNVIALLRAHSDDPVPRPEGMPDGLWQFIEALLSKDPQGRPSAEDVVTLSQSLADRFGGEGPFVVSAVTPDDDAPTMIRATSARPRPEAPADQPAAGPASLPPRRSRRRLAFSALATAVVAALAVGAMVLRSEPAKVSTNAEVVTYSSAPVQLASGVLILRSWEVEAGADPVLTSTLTMTNTTDQPLTDEVEEVIPKGIAADVSRVVFEPEPDATVETDPVVLYRLRGLPAGASQTFTYTVPVTAEGDWREQLAAWDVERQETAASRGLDAITLESLIAAPSSVTLGVDETVAVAVTGRMSDGTDAAPEVLSGITFWADDTSVVELTVDDSGVVLRGLEVGEAEVTAQAGDVTAVIAVKVTGGDVGSTTAARPTATTVPRSTTSQVTTTTSPTPPSAPIINGVANQNTISWTWSLSSPGNSPFQKFDVYFWKSGSCTFSCSPNLVYSGTNTSWYSDHLEGTDPYTLRVVAFNSAGLSAQADLQVYTYAAPYVQFCDQPGFGGNCIQISTSGNFQGTISAWNDNVQSVYVSGGASVALYTGSGFSGCVGVLTSSSSAAPFGRTDISSFRVGVTSCS